jgi:hypothetical protein
MLRQGCGQPLPEGLVLPMACRVTKCHGSGPDLAFRVYSSHASQSIVISFVPQTIFSYLSGAEPVCIV